MLKIKERKAGREGKYKKLDRFEITAYDLMRVLILIGQHFAASWTAERQIRYSKKNCVFNTSASVTWVMRIAATALFIQRTWTLQVFWNIHFCLLCKADDTDTKTHFSHANHQRWSLSSIIWNSCRVPIKIWRRRLSRRRWSKLNENLSGALLARNQNKMLLGRGFTQRWQ